MPTNGKLVRTRRQMLGYLGIAGTSAIAGCFGSDDDGNGGADDDTSNGGEQDEQVFIAGSSGDGDTLVPFQIGDTTSAGYVAMTMDGSYALDSSSDFEVFPLWMDIDTEDGETYHCELRDHLEWSEPYGEMTAEDWVYYITEIHQGEDNWAGSLDAGSWDGVEAEKTGTYTFDLHLPEVDPSFERRTFMSGKTIMPKALIEDFVEDRDIDGLTEHEDVQELKYTGNLGPYTFEQWDRESEYVVTRNDDYYMHDADDVPESWQNAPYFEQYTFNIIPEESSRLASLRTGGIHSTYVPPPRVDRINDEDDTYVNMAPTARVNPLAYNHRTNGWDQLNNTDVRRALGYIVNKRIILEEIERGLGEVAQTYQPSWSEWFVDDGIEEFGVGDSHDYDLAMEELEAALPSDYGYDDGELLGPDGRQVTLDLVALSGFDTISTTAEFIQQEYAEAGIDVDINLVEWSTMVSRYLENEWQGDGEQPWSAGSQNDGPNDGTASADDWDLMYGLNYYTFPLTPASGSMYFSEQGPYNSFGYKPSDEIETLWDEAARTVDEDERFDIMTDIYSDLNHEQPVNFLYYGDDTMGYRSKVSGPIEEWGHTWDSVTWQFEA
ncbi:ABC transporter substrate-binding protein [Natrononativus amylolyticus]|uniref:ABC transporter substrate-binding protein n=1 Tax=Natrononativus amylolyticus TaxID=2963434 RepID=UPI0020CD856A|nr:ABC transporter substrate-binding protein [Natrononativus amylolyticus]